MLAKNGKFCGTVRIRVCDLSEACHMCSQCVNFDIFSPKCQECYPRRNGAPSNCLCAERGLDKRAYAISQALDRPIFDVNGDSGAVEHHTDPSKAIMERLNDEYDRRGIKNPNNPYLA